MNFPGRNRALREDPSANIQIERAHGVTGARIGVSQIDVLRVLAMSGIFMHHLWRGGGERSIIEHGITAMAYIGQFGVIIFNFITGFVLALPYLGRERRSAPHYLEFMQRRFFRIVPTYLLSLVLFTVLNILIFRPPEYSSSVVRFLENAFFLQGLDPSTFMTNMAAYWYLTLLASFYLTFPLVLYLFLRLKPKAACLMLCIMCWGGLALMRVLAPDWEPLSGMLYFNLPARLPEFAIGMWLAAAWKPDVGSVPELPLDRSFSFFSLIAIILALLGAPLAQKMTQPMSLIYQVACSFTFFIALFLFPTVTRLGKSAVIKKLSIASYGIYLTHQPLCTYAGFWLGGGLNRMTKAFLVMITMGPAAYLLARGLESLSGLITTSAFRFPHVFRMSRK